MNKRSEFAQRFELGPKLAESGTSILYRAFDKSLAERPVALKLFSASLSNTAEARQQLSRFMEEADKLRLVSHNTLVPVLTGGYENNYLYLAMELIEGPSLQQYLDTQRGPVDITAAVEIIEQLSGGIKEIHEHGLFHGSLDAKAILFKNEHPRIAGYAPQLLYELEQTQGLSYAERENLQFLAPEQITRLSRPDKRADIYSLAVILYRLLTNRFPFELSGLALLEAKSSTDPEPPRHYNPKLPALIDASIFKALSRERNNRFDSLHEFIDALRGGRRSPKNPLLEILGLSEDKHNEQKQTKADIPLGLSTQAIKQILSLTDRDAKLLDLLRNTQRIKEPDIQEDIQEKEDIQDTQTFPRESFPQGEAPPNPSSETSSHSPTLVASLLVISGPETARQIPLKRRQLIMGSDPACDIVLRNSLIPQHLALLIEKDGDYYLSPIGGKKLKVNNSKLNLNSERKLKDRDTIKFPPYAFRFYRPTVVITRPAPHSRAALDKQALLAMLAISLILIYIFFSV